MKCSLLKMSDLNEIIFILLFSGGSLTWSMVAVQGEILKLLFYKIKKPFFNFKGFGMEAKEVTGIGLTPRRSVIQSVLNQLERV